MTTYRVRNIALAVGIAVLAALLTMFYVSNYKKSVQKGEETVTVFVAAADIAAGTNGADAAVLLKPVEVANKSVVPGAITSKDQVKGLIATTPIFADEQVTVRRFSPVEQAGVRAEIKGNQRAFQLAGDPHQVAAGTLKKGDHVDVVANFRVKYQGDDNDHAITRTVLRDLLVLKAPSGDASGGKLAAASGQTATVQLRVTDNQAQKLYFAYKNSDSWHLDIRAASKATDSSETLETMHSEICDGVRKSVVCVGRIIR
jgi:Flp pilus assembly protein CpaB